MTEQLSLCQRGTDGLPVPSDVGPETSTISLSSTPVWNAIINPTFGKHHSNPK